MVNGVPLNIWYHSVILWLLKISLKLKKEIYHGRKVIGNRVAYYFKQFESKPVKKVRFEDGTTVDATVYKSTKESEIETFVEINLKITEEECREYFINTVGINEARINTISLCTAWKKEINGKEYYQDIRPLTKYNMPNEQLIELSKGLDIVYQILLLIKISP